MFAYRAMCNTLLPDLRIALAKAASVAVAIFDMRTVSYVAKCAQNRIEIE